MDISGVSNSMLQSIANTSTQNGDAVTVSVMKKALDVQEQQAAQMIESVKDSAPKQSEAKVIGGIVDVKA